MRDFKSGRDINVAGDVVINDLSNQHHKALAQCSADELEDEKLHRYCLLEEEKERKNKESFGYIKFALVVGLAVSIWYMAAGESTIAMYIVAFIGVIGPIAAAMSNSNEITEFETRQLEALKEIEFLLRERR